MTDGPMFADAGTLQPGPCTGMAARWCAVHGSCTCPQDGDLDEDGCPLHDSASTHPL